MLDPVQRSDTLRAYSAGRLGTREAIERAGFDDYADLVIALASADLDLPKPAESPRRAAAIAFAAEILQPRLRRGA